GTSSGDAIFIDVPANQWYTAAVAWAADNGIVNGVGGGRFNPDGGITRQELVTVLYRYVQWASENGDSEALAELLQLFDDGIPFNDSDEIADWAAEAVLWGYRIGIINGKPGNLFDPQGTASRAEIAALLHRFVLLLELETEDAPE
ncbi:MAG: S-layer homology domain-containing protein, partial [Oscillospiraceae bacterium]|nr:S-layer homology domain-containing protein [Oscillospiraceae bacterium]